ncbi:MAG TPA: prolyl oligopeptidase family serine peptidase [Ktedonobacterales bacterium]
MGMTGAEYLDALLALPAVSVGGAEVSPDGRWVAWTWLRAGPTADVYAAPTDGSAPPLRLTETTENTRLVSWAPDSSAVVVSHDTAGDERRQFFLVRLERPGELRPLTQRGGFPSGGDLHPNGRWFVYGANVDEATGDEIELDRVYRVDVETGERVALARLNRQGDSSPKLSPDGRWVLYARQDLSASGRQVWLVGIDGQGDREVLNAGADAKVSASWFPDSHRLVVLAETPTYRQLGVWELESGAARWLVDDPARNIERAYVPEGSDEIVVVEVREARVRASLLHPETLAERPMPVARGNLTPLAPVGGDGDGAWAGFYTSARQPADVVRFVPVEADPAAFASLTRVWQRTPLTPGDLASAEEFRWAAPDGLPIQGWLYRPYDESEPRGTIVYVHGGPTSHSQDALNPQIQHFVREGFVVLDPNYRGSTGFGLPFREAIRAQGWGGAEQDDIRAGIEALIAAGIATPGAIGITGTSYGGYSSWCAITRFPPELVAAAAPICGMTDLVLDYDATRPDLRPYSEEMLGGTPEQVPERYYAASPIHFVGNIRGTLLIVQGMRDPNVPPAHVTAVEEPLRRLGIPYEVLAFEDEGHGIGKPANQRVLYQRLARFFADAFGKA